MHTTKYDKAVLTYSGQPCCYLNILCHPLRAKKDCAGLAPAGIKESCGLSIIASPRWGGEENGKKKAKLMGRDKDSLTEQQRKWTVTTIILIRRIYNFSHHPMPRALMSSDSLPPGQLPHSKPSMMWQGIKYMFIWPVWVSHLRYVPSLLLVKINPIPAKPMTKGVEYVAVCQLSWQTTSIQTSEKQKKKSMFLLILNTNNANTKIRKAHNQD